MKEYFPGINKIQFEGINSKNRLSYKYQDKDMVILNKPMKDWLKFSVCYWHTFKGTGLDMFGPGTFKRTWDQFDTLGDNPLDGAKTRADAAFEFFTKLGVEYYTFHDRDIAPEGKNLNETNEQLWDMARQLKNKQDTTSIKLLWGTCNLFSHPRYMNGAGTSPQFYNQAFAGTAIKTMLDVNKQLDGSNFVFWGGREGQFSLLNTDMRKELDNYAQLLIMAKNQRNKIGGTQQFLIEPKPREPTKHQYDYDAQSVMSFIQYYKLNNQNEINFKLNIEPNHTTLAGHEFEHDIIQSYDYNLLGSIDANSGDCLLGWDTDQFNFDVKKSTIIMLKIIQKGGLGSGGLNFDCKVRRESTDLEDLFISHIAAMDVYAQGLIAASKIIEQKELENLVNNRQLSWNENELAKKVICGEADLEMISDQVLKENSGIEPLIKSGQQELQEALLNKNIFQ